MAAALGIMLVTVTIVIFLAFQHFFWLD